MSTETVRTDNDTHHWVPSGLLLVCRYCNKRQAGTPADERCAEAPA